MYREFLKMCEGFNFLRKVKIKKIVYINSYEKRYSKYGYLWVNYYFWSLKYLKNVIWKEINSCVGI